HGDYFVARGARLTYRYGVGVRGEWRVAAGRESFQSLVVAASPANGSFPPNPALGGPGVDLVQLAFERRSEGFAVRRDLHVETLLEAGRQDGGDSYVRLSGAGHLLLPVGSTRLLIRAQGGAASARTQLGRWVGWLGVFRCGAGFGTATQRMGIAFDVSRDFWGIL